MKIPFELKYRPQIESGEYKVEIGCNEPWPARIVCWDLNGNDLIVIVSNPEGREEGLIYTEDGRHKAYSPKIDSNLILVTPEPELTEFEYAMLRYIQDGYSAKSDDDVKAVTRKHSAELLAIARKELRDEIEFRGEEYQTGYKEGQADLLKDLPGWKKMRSDMYCEDSVLSNDRVELRLGSHYILVSDLEKLPKED